MCSEAVWWRCHRRLIADNLIAHGETVIHIMDKGRLEPARLTPGAVNSEVVIELEGGQSIAAIITNAAAKELKLKAGQPASALFKASSVILGVTG